MADLNDQNDARPRLEAFSLEGSLALVTGGGTGLGLEIAHCLILAGAHVIITGRRKEVLDQAVVKLGSSATAMHWDITVLETLPSLIERIEAEFGPLDILVNNAGIHLKKTALETTDEEFGQVVQTNLMACFTLAREAARVMLPRKKGSIIFVGSMASVLGIPSICAYTATKTAVVGMARSLAAEWSENHIRVNALLPGWIDNGMATGVLDSDPERKAKVLSRTPMRRLGRGQDVGWGVVYLCSPAASFITGTCLNIDGGAGIGF